MAEPVVTLARLAPRRGCLEGALYTCRELLPAHDADSPHDVWCRALLEDRIELLELALRQWDQAMRGEEPELVAARRRED